MNYSKYLKFKTRDGVVCVGVSGAVEHVIEANGHANLVRVAVVGEKVRIAAAIEHRV